ncbi:MAG: ABC transporter permease [Vicinamibacteria bacterium]|nr:ABC transporter permease [Vicinamibacteria bacterium]
MDDSILLGGAAHAFRLIASGDARVYEAAFTSIWISCTATAFASAIGLPLGFFTAIGRFKGRVLLVAILNTLLALPTVIVGLFVYALIRRVSLLGPLDLLFSPGAMIVGQTFLAIPIVAALCLTAIETLDPAARETAFTLGASRKRLLLTVAWEARHGLLVAVAVAGGRLIGEVGVSMMLGGNITHYTRTLTTAIALETSKGEFAVAMAMGLILLALALGLNLLLRWIQGMRGGRLG